MPYSCVIVASSRGQLEQGAPAVAAVSRSFCWRHVSSLPPNPRRLTKIARHCLANTNVAFLAHRAALPQGRTLNGTVAAFSSRRSHCDHGTTYPHERQALFDFIGRDTGVVLVAHDVHRTRVPPDFVHSNEDFARRTSKETLACFAHSLG